MADQFVRVRLTRIAGYDLNVFAFDYDLTWAAFFMNASNKIYARFGGRDAQGPDTRNHLDGLRHTLKAALAAHEAEMKNPVPPPAKKPFGIESVKTARQFKGCIHCHYVREIQWAEQKANGTWNRDDIWAYPLPENLGITLALERGDTVKAIAPKSVADKAGLRTGDLLQRLGGVKVHSFADAQYALHKAPMKGTIDVSWLREGKPHDAALPLAEGWRKTNITWRPSMLSFLPSLRVYGDDLTAQDKKALGLDEKRLAFRQEIPVHVASKAAGLKSGDVIVGLDGLTLEMGVDEFLGYVRRNYLIGDRITLDVLRGGKALALPITLK